MGRMFGTDGVRGIANTELTAELALKLGRAAAYVLTKNQNSGEKTKIIIGKDTMLIWHNKYVLYHQAGNDTLCIHYEDGNEESIIGKVTKYKKKNKRDLLQ